MVRRVVRIEIAIALPILFPERYREAIVRAVEQCTVKRHLLEPPRFEISAFPSRREEPVAAEAVLTA
jgi:hypothetical protein